MKDIHKSSQLKDAILELESKKIVAEEALKRQFHETVEGFKPSNILKNTAKEVTASPQFRHNILNVALGLGAGYLSKKVIVGREAGLLKIILGSALQFGVTTLVAKNKESDESVKHKRGGLLKRIFSGTKN